jgi:hypothetical protein
MLHRGDNGLNSRAAIEETAVEKENNKKAKQLGPMNCN